MGKIPSSNNPSFGFLPSILVIILSVLFFSLSTSPDRVVGILTANFGKLISVHGSRTGDFFSLWDESGLPPLKEVKVQFFDETFDIDNIYSSSGNTLPRIIRNSTDMKTFPPHTKWLPSLHTPDSYLRKKFASFHDNMNLLLQADVKYLRGTDAFMGVDKRISVVEGDESLDWLYGGKSKLPENKGMKSYMGLIDIRNLPQLQEDLVDLPSFMKKDSSHSLKFGDHESSLALWVGTGEVDSGLHYDQNEGGFMYLASGKKQILLFPQSDREYLYMRKEPGHQMESSIFIRELIENSSAWEIRRKYPSLSRTKPYIAELFPGDVMYIPHMWFHEVYSTGDSLGVSTWVTNTG